MNKTLKLVLIIIAILAIISIFIICLRIFLAYNINKSTKDTTEVAMNTMNNSEKQLFNQQFDWYNGKTLKSYEVMQLKNKIEMSNINNVNHKVVLKGNLSVNSNKNYTVSITYDTNGYINNITINEI